MSTDLIDLIVCLYIVCSWLAMFFISCQSIYSSEHMFSFSISESFILYSEIQWQPRIS